MPTKNAPHPGIFVWTEILEPAGLTVTDAASVLGVSRVALSTFLNGGADLSAEMALRIEKAFEVRMETLMRMQVSYDAEKTRRKLKGLLVRRYMAPSPDRGLCAQA